MDRIRPDKSDVIIEKQYPLALKTQERKKAVIILTKPHGIPEILLGN